jgi:tetraacyldisaccharide 4'-kinase
MRALLTPVGWLYGGVMSLRNRAFDTGLLPSKTLALPSISVGNLTVGGTGKTPVAAWLVERLQAAGARPAVVLRGYGVDEVLVHRRLNPLIPVIANPDRVAGTLQAKAEGATVVVLDDAFQHRRARRDVDLVLLSADRSGPVRSLPAGPWREPLASLARAQLVAVTRKNASPLRAKELLSSALRFAPGAEGVVIHLTLDTIVPVAGGASSPIARLSGVPVLAISGIGDPRAFQSQLRAAGALVTGESYPDHHAFTVRDAEELARAAGSRLQPVCTLKDAVKLGPLWPAQAPPLWYLSQRADVESGGGAMQAVVEDLAARGRSI